MRVRDNILHIETMRIFILTFFPCIRMSFHFENWQLPVAFSLCHGILYGFIKLDGDSEILICHKNFSAHLNCVLFSVKTSVLGFYGFSKDHFQECEWFNFSKSKIFGIMCKICEILILNSVYLFRGFPLTSTTVISHLKCSKLSGCPNVIEIKFFPYQILNSITSVWHGICVMNTKRIFCMKF